jgi:ABC-2 type transport system permease protein
MMLAIFRKELKTYFTSTIGYIVMTFFLSVAAFVFCQAHVFAPMKSTDFAAYFSFVNSIIMIVLPLITMRVLAEEKGLGTYELLLTSPASPWEIVLGKFFGVLVFVGAGMMLMLVFLIALSFFASVDFSTVIMSMIGMLLSSAFFIAFGMAASSVTGSLVIAAILTYAVFFTLFLIQFLANINPDPAVIKLIDELSFANHYQNIAEGYFSIKDILFFLIGTYIALFFAKTMVESKTWK